VPSATYQLIREAMFAEKQIVCSYDGHRRELCPIVVGHSGKEEKLLAYQIGGTSSKGLPPGGQWKCLSVGKIRDVTLRQGPWREGQRHSQEQRCVSDVDIDINIHVRKLR
jgi:hypothetical protein